MTARVLERPAPRTIEVGSWTHDALRRPIGWAIPMRGLTEPNAAATTIWRHGDHDRPFGVELAHFSPEHGDGFVVRRIECQDLARWVHGVKGAFATSPTSDRELRAERMSMWSEAERSFAMLADLDWTRWALQHLLTGRRASSKRKEAAAHSQSLIHELRLVMERGLRGRVGEEASRPSVYETFVARRIEVVGLRVCECCHVAFETRRRNRPAGRCPACQRSFPRHKMYPLVDGGWHLWARLGPPWHHYADGVPGQRRGVEYGGRCTVCGNEFMATSAKQHLCQNCGGSAGRVRRMRNGSARGRQRFRFTAQDGPLSSVGVRFPNGEQGSLIATDGVVEVSDAELASQLRRNASLRELAGIAASGAENP
jgi:hypothetical protein